MVKLIEHPLKEGVKQLLGRHFGDSIVKNFVLMFEANVYRRDWLAIWKQTKQEKLVLEVHYRLPDGTLEYITDVGSWQSKEEVEYKLLRYISDKVRVGKMGDGWTHVNGKIIEGVYVTPKQDAADTIGLTAHETTTD